MEFYQNASNNTNTLEAAYHSEGRVVANGNKWEYNLKDHLGNVRLVFTESNGLASIVQENHYYPFGMQQNGNWAKTQTVKNDYLYNGKEMNTEIGLNWSDYGARFYDAAVGRWNSSDPLAETYPSHSPYNYVLNNPLINVDPDGRSVWTKLGKAIYKVGKTVYKKGAGALKEGATYADAVSGIIDDGSTVFDGDAGVGERIIAGLSLVSEVLPLSVGDVKDGVDLVSGFAKKANNSTKVENLKKAAEKGIPKSQLGPSGKPKIHTVSKANLKESKDAARDNPKSNTSPTKDSSDKGQKTHHHSTKDGEKMTRKDNVHYEDRSSKRNPN